MRALHVPGRPLLLPNAWDVPSAKAVAGAGYPVVATTSAGVAEALGYEDHEGAPADVMFAAARRIVEAVSVPVTVDSESGYGLAPDDLAAALEDVGAAGCNFEDTDHGRGALAESSRHAERIAAFREACARRDYPLVVNARVDVFLLERTGRPQRELLEEGLERARAYLEAGADCVYPILLRERDPIAAFVEAVDAPVNVLASPDAPAVPELAELGVARVSLGPYLYRRTFDQVAAWLATDYAA